MRIRVESLEQAGQVATVSFTCLVGSARARWMGGVPIVSVDYEVELEVPGILKWGEQIVETKQTRPAISQQAAQALIVGTLSAMRSEGVAEVRVGDDIILVEVDRIGGKVPCNVVIRTADLQLFDINI